jgi:hypothetical protein
MGKFPRKSDGRRVFTVEFKRGVVQQLLKGAVLPESGPLAPRELQPATIRAKCAAGPKLGRRDVR